MSVTKVVLPEKFYLGMIWRENDVPLGFLTPDGTDSAAQKRKLTVDNWVNQNQGYRSQIRMNTCTILNEALPGFKLTKSTRRWTTQNVVWRVVDPRGFEIEISSENLMAILEDSSIINGEILGDLIYARSGNSNILLSVNSPEYVEVVKMTKLLSSNVSFKDVKPGNLVMLSSGMMGKYLGSFYTLVTSSDSRYSNSHETENVGIRPKISDKKTHFFQVKKSENEEHTNHDGQLKILMVSSPKVTAIIDNSEMTLAECYNSIMNHLNTGSGYVSTTSGYGNQILGIVSTKNTPLEHKFKRITQNEFVQSQNNTGSHIRPILCYIKSDKDLYYTYYRGPGDFSMTPKSNTRSSYGVNMWNSATYDISKPEIKDNVKLETPSYWYGRKSYYVNVTEEYYNFIDSNNNLNIIEIFIHDPLGEAVTVWGN